MVTHWETSNRPLFVKTIWQNGQHHVVLYKNGTTTLPTTKRQLSKRSYSSIVSRNFEKLPIRSDNKLQISTMKLLKNDMKINGNKQEKCMNQSDIYQYKNPIVINLTPIESIKYKNLNFERNQTVEYPTIDGNLTERVMVWLDLATPNLRKSKRIERKKRTITANYPKSSNKSKNNQQLQHKPNYYYEDFDDDVDELTTPPLDQDRDEDTNCDELNNFIESKRQLHIFLPVLTNKLSDCGSSLGSSSLLQQNQ